MDINQTDENTAPFSTFGDALSAVVDADILASGTSRTPDQITEMKAKYVARLDAARSAIETGVTVDNSDPFLLRNINEGRALRVAGHNDRANNALVDRLSDVLGYKGELESESGNIPHTAIVTIGTDLVNKRNVRTITVYQPLPNSPKVTGKGGDIWQLARHQTRSEGTGPSIAGLSFVCVQKATA